MEDKIAVVNKREIRKKHLDDMIMIYKQQTKSNEVNEAEKKMLLDQIIDNFLLLEEAEKRQIEIEDEQMDQQISEIKKQFAKEEDFYKELEKNEISYDKFKTNIKDTLVIQKFTRDEVQANIRITADMLEGYYEQHKDQMISPEMIRARHILIGKKQAGSIENAREKIDKIRLELDGKESFESLAKTHSDCPSAEKGGDLGMFGKGQMVPEFEKTAFGLNIGEVSEPVETMFGMHLIKLEEKRAPQKIEFKEAQPYIEKIIYQQEGQKIMKNLAEKLKKSAEIHYF